jgi:hypothetical protein
VTYIKILFEMPKNKIQFLNQIEAKVKDVAGEFIKTAITKNEGIIIGGNTRFTVNSSTGFLTGDEVYIDDKSINSKFTFVTGIIDAFTIELAGDLTLINSGAVIKKSGAIDYLDEAVSIYSKYRPLERIKVEELINPTTVIDLPSDWKTGFSTINFFEYPAGNFPPSLLNEKNFELQLDDNNVYRLILTFPIKGFYRLGYMINHFFDNDNPAVTTIPDIDFYCTCNIAAGIYLLALASRWGESLSPGISADTVDYSNKTDQYRRLAKELFGQAASWLGIDLSALDGSRLEQAPKSCSQTVEPHNSDGSTTMFHN